MDDIRRVARFLRSLLEHRPERTVDRVAHREAEPVPIAGTWKTTLRLHEGRAVFGAPIWLPADPAIPVGAVALPSGEPRELVPDRTLLQRELRGDIPGWLWSGASALVLAIALGFLGTLAWGLGRVARYGKGDSDAAPPASGRFTRPRPGVVAGT